MTLSTPTPADRDEFLAAVDASRDLHHPWVEPADTAERYALYLKRADRTDTACWLVRERRSGSLVGVVNLNNLVWNALCSGHLGYYGFAAGAGQGFMREAVALATSDAFAHLHLHRVEANIQPANARSRALIEWLGFRLEGFSPRYLKVLGEWRDHERWALTVEEAARLTDRRGQQ